jgi:hypothetical protein
MRIGGGIIEDLGGKWPASPAVSFVSYLLDGEGFLWVEFYAATGVAGDRGLIVSHTYIAPLQLGQKFVGFTLRACRQ